MFAKSSASVFVTVRYLRDNLQWSHQSQHCLCCVSIFFIAYYYLTCFCWVAGMAFDWMRLLFEELALHFDMCSPRAHLDSIWSDRNLRSYKMCYDFLCRIDMANNFACCVRYCETNISHCIAFNQVVRLIVITFLTFAYADKSICMFQSYIFCRIYRSSVFNILHL